ncbi:hypothetical protein AKJ16_DCAP20647 [Drosera capensis]
MEHTNLFLGYTIQCFSLELEKNKGRR